MTPSRAAVGGGLRDIPPWGIIIYAMNATITTTYTVTGMTCGHCVAAVTAEVGTLDGVVGVDVDLASGQMTVTSSRPVDDDAIAAAVDEAGYAVSR
ncbi:MAG: cation transporter [Ilumatobacteraceae bacterium]